MNDRRKSDGVFFEGWMQGIDNLCYENYGLSYQDLPDQSFRDWFEDDLSPQEVFDEGLFDPY